MDHKGDVDIVEYADSPIDSPRGEKASSEFAFGIDPVKEKALVRKIDNHVIPMVMVSLWSLKRCRDVWLTLLRLQGLYLMSFIDRVNIGNARLYGLEEDLGMTGNMFQIAVSILVC